MGLEMKDLVVCIDMMFKELVKEIIVLMNK